MENHYFLGVTHVPTHGPCSMANCELNLWEIYGFNGNIIRTIIGQQNIDGYRIWQSSVAGWEIPLSKSRFLAGKINEKLEDLTAGQSSESGF